MRSKIARMTRITMIAILMLQASLEAQEMPGMDMPEHRHHEISMQKNGAWGSIRCRARPRAHGWQPESTPHMGSAHAWNGWELMTHGFANLVYDHQAAAAAADKTFSENMLMGMGRADLRPLCRPARHALGRAVDDRPQRLSAAAADRRDRQRRRRRSSTASTRTTCSMELAATYSVPVGAEDSVFVYAGLPGEPALGPATFMHRFSGMDNPEAPLGHHWLDSTHVTFGVATLGWIHDNVKLEGSVFTGREPDEKRANIETPKMDSWSVRAYLAADARLVAPGEPRPSQQPRAAGAGGRVDRTTASAMYNRPISPTATGRPPSPGAATTTSRGTR